MTVTEAYAIGLIDVRRRYTNEPHDRQWWGVKDALCNMDDPTDPHVLRGTLLPRAAKPEQRQLEAQLLMALPSAPRPTSPVRWVCPQTSDVTVCVATDAVVPLLAELLPTSTADGGVRGVPGLRAYAATTDDLVISSIDQPGRVVLSPVDRTWADVLGEVAACPALPGSNLWDCTKRRRALTPAEAAARAHGELSADVAAVSSALLRRPGLVPVGAAWSVLDGAFRLWANDPLRVVAMLEHPLFGLAELSATVSASDRAVTVTVPKV